MEGSGLFYSSSLTGPVSWDEIQVRALMAPEACQHCRGFGGGSTAGLGCCGVCWCGSSHAAGPRAHAAVCPALLFSALSLLTVTLLHCHSECPSLPTSTTMGWRTWAASATCCWTAPSRRPASAWGAWSPSAPSTTSSGTWAGLALGPVASFLGITDR